MTLREGPHWAAQRQSLPARSGLIMMRYCSLFISSRTHSALPSSTFLASAIRTANFSDNMSPERVALPARLRKAGLEQRPDAPRYSWSLDTNGKVDSDDLRDHLIWLLNRLKKGKLLTDLSLQGFKYHFSVFWGGNGTGGGPLITHEAMAMLTLHGAEMGVCFYYQEAQ